MTDTTMSNQLEMRWVPTTDANGHTRMEIVWITSDQASTVPSHAAA
jgi:hypothetical protein